MDIENKAKNLIEQAIIEKGYILDSVSFVKEKTANFLRIVIDKEGYITIEDCVIVNKLINPLLDDLDVLDDNYILDVCSKEKGSI